MGGVPRDEKEMKAFRDIMDEYGFIDLDYTSHKFTWCGKRAGGLCWKDLIKPSRHLAG